MPLDRTLKVCLSDVSLCPPVGWRKKDSTCPADVEPDRLADLISLPQWSVGVADLSSFGVVNFNLCLPRVLSHSV